MTDMASVLSGWYGYNLFNVASFIEFAEPFPKRRKVDSGSSYLGEAREAVELVAAHRESQARVKAVTYRPYISDTREHKAKAPARVGRPRAGERGEGSREVRGARARVEEQVVEGTTIDCLFPEILGMIFEKLDLQAKGRAAQVCQGWREAAYLRSVWRGVAARPHLRRPNPTLFPSLLRRGIRRVQVLSLRKSLRELVSGLPNLESLNLSGCYNLSDAALDTAFNRDLPSLRHLNLSLCKDVTDNSLGRIATHCKALETLQLGGCTKVTNTGLLLISWGLKRIKSLNLRSCWQISDHGIGHLTGGHAQPGAPTLEELSLQDCQKLTDESLRHIAEGLPAIRRINLSFCVSVTDTGLKWLARLGSLRELNLRSCDNVSDIGLGFLAEGGAALHHLDVSFCDRVSDSSMAHLATGLPTLAALSMSSCHVTDQGIARLAPHMKALHTLNIGQCVKLTDKAAATISEEIRSLRSIDLYGCTKISSEGLKVLNKCENLKVVNLGLWHPF